MNAKTRGTLVPLLALLLLALPAVAQDSDVAATVEVSGPDGDNSMHIKLGAEHVRLDMASPQGDASMVWGPTSMLMIMHSQSMYMEFDEAMLERMRQMTGAMGQAGGERDEPDPSAYTFETTGSTDTIHGLEAFEVAMTGPDGKTGKLWLSTAAEVGMFEVMARMSDKLSAFTGAGRNPLTDMQGYMAMARAQGLPAGKVLRIVDDENGMTMTLGEVAVGPLDASTWQAPEGYEKRQMPMMPR